MIVDQLIVNPSASRQLLSGAHQVRLGGYSLINPLLECELGQEKLSKQFISFRLQLEKKINSLKSSGKAEDLAVYFRDLNTGATIGVNSNEGFTPASLLKLPILMAYLKQSESDPGILKKTYTYSGDQDRNEVEHAKPTKSMDAGRDYTVENLLNRMIVYSDNNAMALLVEGLPIDIQDKVYKDLGIIIPGVRGTEDFMSVSEYSSFFRILYNASYLSKNNSQKALDMLAKVDFADGLRAGVPKGVVIANKFGERGDGVSQQLHDCGIVYFKDHPYLLCIMSKGNNFDQLASTIREVSGFVYSEVSTQVQL